MRDALTLVIRGGLGNQLQQFAIANSIAQKQGKRIEIDARHLPVSQKQSRSGVTVYPFLLSGFEGLEAPVRKSKNSLSRFFFRLLVEIRRRAVAHTVFEKMFRGIVVDESVGRRTLESLDPKVIISLLAGIPLTADEISSVQKHLRQPRQPSQLYKSLSIELDLHKTIGVHIRRGDYVKLAHVYGYISDEWYVTQIKRLVSSHEKILVFTDAAGSGIDFGAEFGNEIVQVIDKNDSIGAVEVLSLLSRCSSLVLSNSSFSRWAVGLSNTVNTVICPMLPANLQSVCSITDLEAVSSAEIVAEPIF